MTAAVDTLTAADVLTSAADDIDPELLRVIQGVAHREFLLPHGPSRTSSLTRPVRRRPAPVVRAPRATAGTTARKVTRSR